MNGNKTYRGAHGNSRLGRSCKTPIPRRRRSGRRTKNPLLLSMGSVNTHKGQDFCYSGYWKVYANEEETRALFDRYAHCIEDFCSRLEQGCSFPDLVRAV